MVEYNWLVLIYANGNNDLDPEIYQRFLQVKDQDVPEDSAIIIQIARAAQNVVKAFRPQYLFLEKECWSGVRRYLIKSNQTILAEDLGNVNMADTATLENFITWGIQNYPAKYIMVILSSHGGGFVWHMTDFMQSIPYAMSMEGLIRALSLVKVKTNRSIDLLIMDTCYMNMLEIWYDFAYAPESPVGNLMVAAGNLPLEGLDYTSIIQGINGSNEALLGDILSGITNSFNHKLGIANGVLLIQLNQQKFQTVKGLISQLGDSILDKDIDLSLALREWYAWRPHYPLISILDLLSKIELKYPDFRQIADQVIYIISEIMMAPSIRSLPRNQTLGPCMYLETNPVEYSYFQLFYEKMVFSQQNQWSNVLSNKKPAIQNNVTGSGPITEMLPFYPMHMELVLGFLLFYNPGISYDNACKVLKGLGWMQ